MRNARAPENERERRPNAARAMSAARRVALLAMLVAAGCEEVPIGDDGGIVPSNDGGPAGPDAMSVCSSNAQCDDANPCTTDACKGGVCSYTPAPGGRCVWGICDVGGNCGLDPSAPCTGSSYEGRDLRPYDLSLLDLHCANLRGANLEGALLDGRDLGRADLTGARLRGARLAGADLSRATLENADLSYADLFGARTEGADFTGADLTGAL
jgi:hypothetical protein